MFKLSLCLMSLGMLASHAYSATVVKRMPKKRLLVVKPEPMDQDFYVGDLVRIEDNRQQGLARGKVIRVRPQKVAIKIEKGRLALNQGDQVTLRATKGADKKPKEKDSIGLFARVNPILYIQDTYNGSMGFAASDHITLGLMGSYVDSKGDWSNYSGYMVGPQLAYHLGGVSEHGFFVKVMGGYADLGLEVLDENSDVMGEIEPSFFFAGGIVGYQLAFANGIQIHLGVGGQYHSYDKDKLVIYEDEESDEIAADASEDFLPQFAPTGEISLGFML